jgi:saccharopine dehydrogenase (NAD+, L-glutamate forming)
MKNILLLGAGKSSAFLIQYLLKEASTNQWLLRIGDKDLSHAQKVVANHPNAVLFHFDLGNSQQLENEVVNADLVISLLPAHLHIDVAKSCVKHQKNMANASYISDAMAALDQDAKAAGIVILNEIGLDPPPSHVSPQATSPPKKTISNPSRQLPNFIKRLHSAKQYAQILSNI